MSEKIRAAAWGGRARPRRGESESSRAPAARARVQCVGVNSLGLILCLHAPRPQNHIVIAFGGGSWKEIGVVEYWYMCWHMYDVASIVVMIVVPENG